MPFSSKYTRIAPNLLAPAGAPPFTYSDGEIEEYIAAVVAAASDRSVMSPELARAGKDWASYYHLNYRRSFLLRPVSALLRGANVLELGAGCGALTRYLGETAQRVVALEGSAKRAHIAASRCRDLDNVTVVSDTIQGLELDETFDVVTLIGVLEYARSHGEAGNNTEAAILAAARSYLKPGGRLLLAIENQLGLKYFAGALEDHVGMPFFGIHDLYGTGTPVTFGRKELCSLMAEAGFATMEQFVPLPDYKFPATVLFPGCFNEAEPSFDITPLVQSSYREDQQKSSEHCFSLEAATSAIVRNGLTQELCNSFFFVASPDPGSPAFDSARCAAHYGAERAPEYAKETLFLRENGTIRVQRAHLAPDLPRRPDNGVTNTLEDEELLPYPLYHANLVKIVNWPWWEVAHVAAWAKGWVDFLRARASDGKNLPASFLDATPLNCVALPESGAGGSLAVFDQEWSLADSRTIPLSYVVFRGLCQSLGWFENVAPPAERTPTRLIVLVSSVMAKLGLPLEPETLDGFIRMELEFLAAATHGQQDAAAFRARSLDVRSLA